MQLNLLLGNEQHTSGVTSTCWNPLNSEFMLSVSDNGELKKWSEKAVAQPDFNSSEFIVFCAPNINTNGFILGDAAGKLHFASSLGRIEKSFEAHSSPVTILEWNGDSAFFTASDDGCIKIWSSNGMLRSVLFQSSLPIFAACWSPFGDSIAYSSGKTIIIKPLVPTLKAVQWKAHDGLVSSIDWNKNGIIVSGGEDFKYKTWDKYGRLIYCSSSLPVPVTCCKWSPRGDCFLVAAGSKLLLNNSNGFTKTSVELKGGSIYSISWTRDGRQFSLGTARGSVLVGQAYYKTIERGEYTFIQSDSNKISVEQATIIGNEVLEYKDPIVLFEARFNHLIVATTTQVYIHSFSNLNTPHIHLLNGGQPEDLLISNDNLVLVKNLNAQVLSFEGKQLIQFKVNPYSTLASSSSLLSLVDGADRSTIIAMDLQTGRQSLKFKHSSIVKSIASFGGANSRYTMSEFAAIIDEQKDLWLIDMYRRESVKIAGMVDCVQWNEFNCLLAAITDGLVKIWYNPASVFINEQLNAIASYTNNENLLNASIDYFGSVLTVEKPCGTKVMVPGISPFIGALHSCVTNRSWEKAIRLARYAKSKEIWASLAGMSLQYSELNTAEVAFAALEMTPHVLNICKIKQLSNQDWQKAEICLLKKQYNEAEQILTAKGHFYRALKMWIELFQWEKAVELGLKHRNLLDILLFYRSEYLKTFNLNESNAKFIDLNEKVPVDAELVRSKVEQLQ